MQKFIMALILILSINIFAQEKSVGIYLEREDQPNYQRAAETWKKEMEQKSPGTTVELKGVKDKVEFEKAWNSINQPGVVVKEIAVFSHGSKGDQIDGLEFPQEGKTSTLSREDIGKLGKLNWDQNGSLHLNGCNTGKTGEDRDWCPASEFASRQNITTYGESGYSYFSQSKGNYEKVTANSSNVYLAAYERTMNVCPSLPIPFSEKRLPVPCFSVTNKNIEANKYEGDKTSDNKQKNTILDNDRRHNPQDYDKDGNYIGDKKNGAIVLDSFIKTTEDVLNFVITGIEYNPESGYLKFLGKNAVQNNDVYFSDLIVALQIIYGNRKSVPIISIDPIMEDPYGNKMQVCYYGGIDNTHIGQIAYETDRLLKCLIIGKDNITKAPITCDVPGYVDKLKRMNSYSKGRSGWARYWISSNEMELEYNSISKSIYFTKATLKLSYKCCELKKDGLSEIEEQDLASEAFVKHFNENFVAFSREYPIFERTLQVFKAFAFARWMYDHQVPISCDFLYNFPLKLQKTPEVTYSIMNEEGSLSIFGGINFQTDAIMKNYKYLNTNTISTISTIHIPLDTSSSKNYHRDYYSFLVQKYNRILELTPNDWNVYYERGNAYYGLQKYKEAIIDYNQVIELYPSNTHAYYNRGNAHDELKENNEALADYTKALELTPNYVKIYNNRANIYYRLKEYEKALIDYEKALELNPKYAYTYNNRGNLYFALKEYEKALGDYNNAIKINSEYSNAYYNRANVYFMLEEYEKALVDYNKAVKLNPLFTQAYNNREKTYIKMHSIGDNK